MVIGGKMDPGMRTVTTTRLSVQRARYNVPCMPHIPIQLPPHVISILLHFLCFSQKPKHQRIKTSFSFPEALNAVQLEHTAHAPKTTHASIACSNKYANQSCVLWHAVHNPRLFKPRSYLALIKAATPCFLSETRFYAVCNPRLVKPRSHLVLFQATTPCFLKNTVNN